jgi:oxygen-dependent protoporphyrinogen oxidase
MRGEIAKDRAPKFSFDEGLQVLPDTLREFLGDAVRLHAPVTGLARSSDGLSLDVRLQDGTVQSGFRAVVHAGTAFQLARLQVAPVGSLLSQFSEIRHPPVASVVLGFRREDVSHPCQGFGALIPGVEGFRILGTIFSSSLFPNRAPGGHITLTSYIGGERQPELAALPPEELVDLTLRDLGVLFGVKGRPTFRHCAFYPRAIPQYNIGYGRHREAMNEIERAIPGLFFAGHYRDGISLGDSIVSGCNIAERVENFLASGQSFAA